MLIWPPSACTGAEDLGDHLGLLHLATQRQADQHVARGAEVLRLHLAVVQGLDGGTHLGHVGRLGVAGFDDRAAGELDGQVQPPGQR